MMIVVVVAAYIIIGLVMGVYVARHTRTEDDESLESVLFDGVIALFVALIWPVWLVVAGVGWIAGDGWRWKK